MALSEQDKRLLNEVFSQSLESPKGTNLARFRADNAELIPELNQLEALGYLHRSNDLYYLDPLALAYLAEENPDAQSIIEKCSLIFAVLQGEYRDNLGDNVLIPDIAMRTGLSDDDVRAALRFIRQTPILAIDSQVAVAPAEVILKYKSFEDILREREEWDKHRYAEMGKSRAYSHSQTEYSVKQETSLSATSGKANWEAIRSEFGITKTGFGKRINFVKNPFEREIIFRDVEQAFVLDSLGFSKSAVILAGGVIEELLRLYLQHKQVKPVRDDFDGYIQTCEQNRLLEVGISRLSDSARHFRNLVHLSKEKTKKDTTSKSKAKGAVASIFTIADCF